MNLLRRQTTWILLAIGGIIPAVGCGPAGPGRVQVHGTVTHGGRLIPAGEMIFEPDPERDNSGPQGRATIKNGHYRTTAGKGSVAGPVVIRVEAYDGQPHRESPRGIAMFPPYLLKLDLPDSDSEQNIDVPASHGGTPAPH